METFGKSMAQNHKEVMSILHKITRRLVRHAKLAINSFFSKTQKQDFSPEELRSIREARKNIKVYDAVLFFNEIELLEIRLNILDPYVDFFVIVECMETFSGLPKKLYFEENIERFQKFRHKIIHHIVKGEKKFNDFWSRESFQRESIKDALTRLGNEDFCFVSDVDEIWNPEAIVDWRENSVYKFRQKMYAYYLNNRSSEKWAGTFAAKWSVIKGRSLNDMRDAAKTNYVYVENGGWHFTNQGGAERIKTKIESYSHSEFNTPEIKSDIEKKITENRDFVGRGFKFWTDENELPQYLLTHKKDYLEFFR